MDTINYYLDIWLEFRKTNGVFIDLFVFFVYVTYYISISNLEKMGMFQSFAAKILWRCFILQQMIYQCFASITLYYHDTLTISLVISEAIIFVFIVITESIISSKTCYSSKGDSNEEEKLLGLNIE